MWWWWGACQGPTRTDGPRRETNEAAHSAVTAPIGSLVFDGPAPKNLVVLSVDTTRKDHFSRYDPAARGLTPFVDARMAEGVVLDDLAHCSNWTVASSSCLFWGASLVDRAPSVGMVPILFNDNSLEQKVPDAPGFAHAMTDAGVETLLVTANSWFGEFHGSVQGFSRYYSAGHVPATQVWAAAKSGMSTDPLDAPFYLHLHFFEPHDPYLPPAEYLPTDLPDPGLPLDSGLAQDAARALFPAMPPEQQQALIGNFRGRYEAEVRYWDDQMGQIWAELDEGGFLDDTLVVVYTDHGEGLYERDYFGHAFFLPPAENDAVAFFWAKNLRPAAVKDPWESIDLAPTMLQVFGVPTPAGMTGRVIGRDAARPVRTAFTDAFAGPVNSVRDDRWLMQFHWLSGDDAIHVCDRLADPDCVVNHYDPAAPTLRDRRLWEALEPEVRAVAPFLTGDFRVPDGPPWPAPLME